MIEGTTAKAATRGFARTWLVGNTLALMAGYLLYTPIGHGFTGGHGRELNGAQLVSHTLALSVVALFVALAQRRMLAPHARVPASRIPLAILLFVGLFWAGYYLPLPFGLDWDILFGFTALGASIWIGHLRVGGHPIAALVAFLAFPAASFLGEVIIYLVVINLGLEPKIGTDPIMHSVFFLTVALTTGLVGGGLSGKALERMLPA
ncbi:hypothetical protein ABI59_13105 [Acidobacteria bacterium Mor1]|nr:hypothetical protein ABI59_13105 [Acidobacteria bacterium Mor1]